MKSRHIFFWILITGLMTGLTVYISQVQAIESDAETSCIVLPPEMLPVPAGSFEMGRPYDLDDVPDPYERLKGELPVHSVYLDEYEIGKYPVTNGQFAKVLNWAHSHNLLQNANGERFSEGVIHAYDEALAETAGYSAYCMIAFADDSFCVRERQGYKDQFFSMVDHPVFRVSWYGAICFCNWLSEIEDLEPCYDPSTWERYEPVRNGYRLPTEAEWERAAAWDGEKHWRYGMPGDSISHEEANFGRHNPMDLITTPYTTPVGWYNGIHPSALRSPETVTLDVKSPVGAYDMCGNVLEWCHDWYDRNYYAVSPPNNPTGPEPLKCRILRGPDWSTCDAGCRMAFRSCSGPGYRSNFYGFRLARTPE
ncbi:MAG: formylglycine-generating enzyme family protein [Candidatus Hydrogenedens sp.]|jgi:formylglycine-generating enzyme required for sulfatase activity|nr:formylglycine-generating enzyme family protein [Candidatus Hydrogenedens sp.]